MNAVIIQYNSFTSKHFLYSQNNVYNIRKQKF